MGKFDPSSGNADRPTFASTQRGMYTAGYLDGSGSSHGGMDNQISSTLPSMSTSSSPATEGEVMTFLHGLPFNTKFMPVAFSRQLEVERAVTSALCVSQDDPSSLSLNGRPLPASSHENIKRVRNNLSESSNRARERVKTLEEVVSRFDMCFPRIAARKRSLVDMPLSDRSTASLLCDRAVFGGNMAKLRTEYHVMASNVDIDPQNLEERNLRTKGAVPKRVWTSLADVRMDAQANDVAKPTGALDKDKETFRYSDSGAVLFEEIHQTSTIGLDGWEKPKMRKKRSGIKPQASTGMVLPKHVDGDQDSKWALQQRLLMEVRPELSKAHGFRSSPAVGATGGRKVDTTSQKEGLGFHSSSARTDQDNGFLPTDRRDTTLDSEKEMINLKSVNRPNVHEDIVSSGGPTSFTKLSTSARAPLSGSCMIPKSSPNAYQAIGVPEEWKLAHCVNKVLAVVGASNRKHPQSSSFSLPPVAQWAGQRPRKISRVARRTNLVYPVPVQDETPTSDTVSHAAGNGNGLGLQRCLSSNASQQVEVEDDPLSSVALTESEESRVAETKSMDKGKKSDETDERTGLNVQKVSALELASKKNKASNDEELGDGLRKQERVFTSTWSSMAMIDKKLDNMVKAKQQRNRQVGFEKTDSKAGRPPTKKMSGRKAYRRPKFARNGGSTNNNGEPDNDHEMIMAAEKAAMDPSAACSSSFWEKMDVHFGSVSDEAVAFLKQQNSSFNKSASGMNVNSGQNLRDDFEISSMKPTLSALGQDDSGAVKNRLGSIECERDKQLTSETKPEKYLSEQLLSVVADDNVIPLFQRLLSALIPEEDEDLNLNIYGTNSELDEEKRNNLSWTESDNFQTVSQDTSNEYRIRATQRSLDQMENCELGDVDFLADTTIEIVSNIQNSLSGPQPDQAVMPVKAHSELQYEEMTLDERVQLELQSIGIFPGPGPTLALQEDDEINAEISTLQLKQQDLANKKKAILLELESSVSKERESQEREIERKALDKLVCMTYDKYMASCRRGSNRKKAKLAPLDSLERTLKRCRNYEDTGKSCFNNPIFKDLFHSVTTCPNDAEIIHTMTGGKPANPSDDTHSFSSEVRVSDSLGLHQTPSATSCLRLNTNTLENNPSDVLGSGNHLAEPTACNKETLMSRAKKRELLLDEHVSGTGGSSLRAPSVVGDARVSSTKGKRSEKEEEGKGQNWDLPSGNGTDKFGLPALGNVKDKRKAEVKPKQKTTHLSASADDLLDKSSEPPKAELSPILGLCEVASDSNIKKNDDLALETLNDIEGMDLSNLQLPGTDILGSWLNIDDDGLPEDHDYVGLEIPADDLSEIDRLTFW